MLYALYEAFQNVINMCCTQCMFYVFLMLIMFNVRFSPMELDKHVLISGAALRDGLITERQH